jgi:hypothetical protein
MPLRCAAVVLLLCCAALVALCTAETRICLNMIAKNEKACDDDDQGACVQCSIALPMCCTRLSHTLTRTRVRVLCCAALRCACCGVQKDLPKCLEAFGPELSGWTLCDTGGVQGWWLRRATVDRVRALCSCDARTARSHTTRPAMVHDARMALCARCAAAGSTDGTPQIAQEYFKKHKVPGSVVYHKWTNSFAANRNQCIEVRHACALQGCCQQLERALLPPPAAQRPALRCSACACRCSHCHAPSHHQAPPPVASPVATRVRVLQAAVKWSRAEAKKRKMAKGSHFCDYLLFLDADHVSLCEGGGGQQGTGGTVCDVKRSASSG